MVKITDETYDSPSEGARLTYREDDTSFKKRLNTMIQIAWVYNTAVTIIIVAVLFYLLGFNMVLGILMGVLLSFFTSFPLTMFQVTNAKRWEIYRNRFVMPKGLGGDERVVMFNDIESIELRKDLTGEKVVIHLRTGQTIIIDVKGQKEPLSILMMTFDEYDKAHSKRVIEIPISMVDDAQESV